MFELGDCSIIKTLSANGNNIACGTQQVPTPVVPTAAGTNIVKIIVFIMASAATTYFTGYFFEKGSQSALK